LAVFGMMMTSISKEYWQIMLAQSLCVGLGLGCLFVPRWVKFFRSFRWQMDEAR
jgi:hypothetical protein